jgi:hypothetical protein
VVLKSLMNGMVKGGRRSKATCMKHDDEVVSVNITSN